MEQKRKMEVGIKELKNKTTQIIRDVREKGSEYVITVNNIPVAVITSLAKKEAAQEKSRRIEILKSIEALSKNISKDWDAEVGAVEAVAEQRRG